MDHNCTNYLILLCLSKQNIFIMQLVIEEVCLLSVTERSPYTSTLNLTYLLSGELPESENAVQYPDMRVRVYHDAHVVEAQEWAVAHGQPVLKALRTHAERELDQRWARNVMLNKWLEYCVERGHRFSPATRLSAET